MFEGAIYHAFSRSNRGELILPGDEEKGHFVRRLHEGALRYDVEMYAFCIMGTHYHLLFQTRKANLPDFMHFVLSSYASYLSARGWSGHVFKGRYNAHCIDEEEYFLIVSKYIHLNPVEAALVDDPAQYTWSSYPFYIRDIEPPEWLDVENTLEYFDPDKEKAKVKYRKFVENDMDKPYPYPHDRVVGKAILGNEEFVKKVLEKCRNDLQVKEAAGQKELLRRMNLEDLSRVICARYGLSGLRKTSYNQGGILRWARQLFIYIAREYSSSSNRQIADFLGDIGPSAVSASLRKTRTLLETDAAFRKSLGEEISTIIPSI